MNDNQWKEDPNGIYSIKLVPALSEIFPNTVLSEWLSEQGKSVVLNVKKVCVDTGGKKRKIYAPDMPSKMFYQTMLPTLNKVFENIEERKVAFGFVPRRSCVDQALQHMNYSYTISLDIKDFF
ncbi:hypothetical protein [Photobacterium leiognathi]|uniref:hypothetical protein n=1 Tax=Photobacterium leiognathi TaxID=553611 RepID=UPI0027343B6B|nr:hypothetical protein [Photobacterium leiognathi]